MLQSSRVFGHSPEGLPRMDTSGIFPDPWRDRVYALHRGHIPMGRMVSVAEAQQIVDAACAKFGRTTLPVMLTDFPAPAYEFDERTGQGFRILFPGTDAAAAGIAEGWLLHEVAHHLAVSVFQRETHGPLYASLLLALCEFHFGRELDAPHGARPLPRLSAEALEQLREMTFEEPMDVEEMRAAVAKMPGLDPVIGTYYDALPSSRVLAARIESLYALNRTSTSVAAETMG